MNRLCEVLVDVVDKVADPGVDTRETGLSTADAPRNDTLEDAVGVDDGAAGVAGARVLTALGEAGAEHVVGDAEPLAPVVGLAGGAGDDGDGDLVQARGDGVGVLAGGAPVWEKKTGQQRNGDFGDHQTWIRLPASGGDGRAGRRIGALGGKSGVADGGALGDRAGQVPDGNVEVCGAVVIGRVHDDLGDADQGTARIPGLPKKKKSSVSIARPIWLYEEKENLQEYRRGRGSGRQGRRRSSERR